MAISITDTDGTGFGITAAGFVYNFPAGAPGANDWDILFVNSDALVSTPAGGWTLARSEINDQGSYAFVRQGGSGSSVTVATPSGPGPFNANLSWARLSGAQAVDVTTGAQATGNNTTTPAVNTGTLAATGEAVMVYAALHGFATAPASPNWSSGYTPAENTSQGTGGTACAGLLGYKLNAGTAAETPVVTWTNNVLDRYVLVVTFTPAATPVTDIQPNSITLTTSLGAPSLTWSATVVPDSITDPIVLGPPTVDGPPPPPRLDPVVELFIQAQACLCTASQANPSPPQHCAPRVGTEVLYDIGQYTDLCCEGLSYVMLGDTYLSADSFPEQDLVRQVDANCVPPAWAQVIRMGLVRCISAGQPDGEPATDAMWTAEALQNLADSQTLRQASCCFRNWVVGQNYGDLYDGMSVVIQRQVQTNPQGGCVERYVDIVVQFPDVDCGCA